MKRTHSSLWTTTACSAALMLALAGCGNNNGGGSNGAATGASASPTNSASATATASASASASASSPATPSGSASTAPSATPSASAAASPAKSPEITYRMSKSYDIKPIDKAKSPSKVVLLSFDDGVKSDATLKPMLDALDKHHAKAIFFVNGFRVKEHPELLKEVADRGQVIGNHSYDHIMLGKENEANIRQQIGKVQDIVKQVTGQTPVFFRPPFASANDAVHAVAKEHGLLYMTWSNGSLDWDLGKLKDKDKPQAVIDNIMKQLHPGSNILMHELPWTAEVLDRLLTELEAKGYSFVDPNAIDTTGKA